MKKVYILIGLIMLLLTTYEVANSYAKYVSQGVATAEKQAGAWVVKVNNSDISSKNSNKQFQINSLICSGSNYVLENKLAPSSRGYFDVVIDTSGCSVAIKYDVTIDLTALNINTAMNFDSAYLIVNGTETNGIIRTGESTYSGTLSLNDIKNNKTATARFYLSWTDDGTGVNDGADSTIGVLRQIQNLGVPVSITVSQYSGEQIVQYQ